MQQKFSVQLDEELVAFVDALVEDGGASSLEAVIAQALERECARRAAIRDAEVLARTEPDAELDAIVRGARQATAFDLS